MERIEIYYAIVGALVILNVVVIYIAIKLGKSFPYDGREMYNEDGDHIYYDRKLIRHKQKSKR